MRETDSWRAFLAPVYNHHILEAAPGHQFKLTAGGTARVYRDMRAALLCQSCRSRVMGFYRSELITVWATHGLTMPLATGAFGAMLLGAMPLLEPFKSAGILWNPKSHGIEWSIGDSADLERCAGRVILLDDVVTSGETMRRLRDAALERGLIPVELAVLYPLDLTLQDFTEGISG